MDKRDRNEQAFETLLAENLTAPPETVVAGVTPGHRALRRVLWGSALCTVTLQVSGLQYILPTVGLVLLLLGFLQLHQNRNLHQRQFFSSQGVVRLFFQPVMQQFYKLSAGDGIRHSFASFQNRDNDSTLSFKCQPCALGPAQPNRDFAPIK